MLTLAAITSVHGIPYAEKRAATATTSTIAIQATEVPQVDPSALNALPAYMNADGTEDFESMWAKFDALAPLIVLPDQVSNVTVVVDPEAISSIVQAQAVNTINSATEDSSSSSGAAPEKRAVTPAFGGYGTGAGQCGSQVTASSKERIINSPDTPDAFSSSTYFASKAQSAKTPVGYIGTQNNKQATYQVADQNKGTYELSAYDPSLCSAKCDAASGCQSFTIYFERDPSIKTVSTGGNCNNPPSYTTVGCQLWSGVINKDSAMTNTGQYRGDYFKTAKAGVNAYTKSTSNDGKGITGYTEKTFPNGKIGNQYVTADPYAILYTDVLQVDKFDAQNCANVLQNLYPNNGVAFETWRAVRDNTETGQGCIILSRGGFKSDQANDAGQWYGDNKYYAFAPVYYYEKN